MKKDYTTYKTIIADFDDKSAWDLEKIDYSEYYYKLNLRYSSQINGSWTYPGGLTASLNCTEEKGESVYIFEYNGKIHKFDINEIQALMLLLVEQSKIEKLSYSEVKTPKRFI